MLVLTRRVGEEIIIAENVRVTVVSVEGGKVRLGIAAPASVPVYRKEILDRAARALPSHVVEVAR